MHIKPFTQAYRPQALQTTPPGVVFGNNNPFTCVLFKKFAEDFNRANTGQEWELSTGEPATRITLEKLSTELLHIYRSGKDPFECTVALLTTPPLHDRAEAQGYIYSVHGGAKSIGEIQAYLSNMPASVTITPIAPKSGLQGTDHPTLPKTG